jgi:hypothetical protein
MINILFNNLKLNNLKLNIFFIDKKSINFYIHKKYCNNIHKIKIFLSYSSIYNKYMIDLSQLEINKYFYNKKIENIQNLQNYEFTLEDNKNYIFNNINIINYFNIKKNIDKDIDKDNIYKNNNISVKIKNYESYDIIKKYDLKKISLDCYENNYLIKNDFFINNIIKNSNKDMKFKLNFPCYNLDYLCINENNEIEYNDVYSIIKKIEEYYYKYDYKLEEICLKNNSTKMSLYDFVSIVEGIKKIKIPIELISFESVNFDLQFINIKLLNYCLDNNIYKFNIYINNEREYITKKSIYYDKENSLNKINRLINIYNYEKNINRKDFFL